jgi:hypothetical protein
VAFWTALNAENGWPRHDSARSLNTLRRLLAVAALAVCFFVTPALAQDSLQWSGYAFLRGSSAPDHGPLEARPIDSQLHFALDWLPSPNFLSHLHLVARSDSQDSKRGSVGIVEAYAEGNFVPRQDRVRVRAGAMFLPTSRENVDALWETTYTLTPSALNSWFGEELRPIGVDVTWFHGPLMGGATLFAGNETFGALPAGRGWRMRDHWALLGEHIRVDPEYYASVSSENDHHLGWSARGGYRGEHLVLQLTHIDNQSDALEHGELFNWNTQWEVVAAEYSNDRWTLAGESGWGPSEIIVRGTSYTDDLRASYLLVSRLLPRGRATLRVDQFGEKGDTVNAVTAACFWTPPGPLRVGAEGTVSDDDRRLSLELRYHFGR